MEKTKTGIFTSIIDFIKAFGNTDFDEHGRIDEEKLSPEERKELEKIRKMDQVEKLEGRAYIKKRYGVTVDAAEANKNAERVVSKPSDKTIGSK